ncbi:MAG: serine/threonine-protein kinase [archaeon]|nr:serine/threonine-protein kinase [archaeon]
MFNNIQLQSNIGKGAFGAVYLGVNTKTGQKLAVKKVQKRLLQSKVNSCYFNNEIYILKHMKPHPNIIKFYDIFSTLTNYYAVFQYCNGGTLDSAYKAYKEKYKKSFSEAEVHYIVQEILKGLVHLNKENIIHRDIKSENILLDYNTEEDKENINVLKAKIIIIDFGFARYLKNNDLATSIIGTPLFMDPSILHSVIPIKEDPKINSEEDNTENKNDPQKLEEKKNMVSKDSSLVSYDFRADIWSLGILTYEILFGVLPFNGKNAIELMYSIKNREFTLPPDPLNYKVSRACVNFLQKILTVDFEQRPDAYKCSNDAWIKGIYNPRDMMSFKSQFEIDRIPIIEKNYFINLWREFKVNPRTEGRNKRNVQINNLIERLRNQKGNIKGSYMMGLRTHLSRLGQNKGGDTPPQFGKSKAESFLNDFGENYDNSICENTTIINDQTYQLNAYLSAAHKRKEAKIKRDVLESRNENKINANWTFYEDKKDINNSDKKSKNSNNSEGTPVKEENHRLFIPKTKTVNNMRFINKI